MVRSYRAKLQELMLELEEKRVKLNDENRGLLKSRKKNKWVNNKDKFKFYENVDKINLIDVDWRILNREYSSLN